MTGKQGVTKGTSRVPKHRNSGTCQSVHFEKSPVLTVDQKGRDSLVEGGGLCSTRSTKRVLIGAMGVCWWWW